MSNLRSKRRPILIIEALFLGAFGFMTVLRALNPDLWQTAWGGEKPFEFGFLNAILRSPVMPPYDPFFSEGVINYYYYGLFLVSVPVKAIGIAPAVAFNLIVPTLFALTLIGAFALVRRLTGRVWAGLAGGAAVALLGNLAAAFPVGLGRRAGTGARGAQRRAGRLWRTAGRLVLGAEPGGVYRYADHDQRVPVLELPVRRSAPAPDRNADHDPGGCDCV